MDGLTILGIFGIGALLGGIIGGVIGMMAAVELIRFGDSKRRVVVSVEAAPITAHVTAPAVVDVPVVVHIPPIAPLSVPIVMAAPPNVAELAERVLAEAPEMGPEALARIVGCAEDTAYALILDWRDAQGPAEEALPVREELCAWTRPPLPAELTG